MAGNPAMPMQASLADAPPIPLKGASPPRIPTRVRGVRARRSPPPAPHAKPAVPAPASTVNPYVPNTGLTQAK